MKIETKVNILLVIVFAFGMLISGVTLSNALQQKAENEVNSKALLLLKMANSVREYTNNNIATVLAPSLETQEKFIPESIPSFSIRLVFENLRKNPEYNNFKYKDAVVDPTNPKDQADSFELNLINKFNRNPTLKSQTGFTTVDGNKLFYSANPLILKEAKCLRCHSTPEQAPKSQIATYGSKNGFNWKLNSIIGTQIVYFPAQNIFNAAFHSLSMMMWLLIFIFTLILVMMNILLRRIILKRITKMSSVAKRVSTGAMDANFENNYQDEIGDLAEAFNRMKRSLEIALNLLNRTKS
jgi:HAMP domain-containing protein